MNPSIISALSVFYIIPCTLFIAGLTSFHVPGTTRAKLPFETSPECLYNISESDLLFFQEGQPAYGGRRSFFCSLPGTRGLQVDPLCGAAIRQTIIYFHR